MTTFKETAIEQFHQRECDKAAYQREQATEFATRASRSFARSFQIPVEFTTVDKYDAIAEIDGLCLKAHEEYDAPEFYLQAECSFCGEGVWVHIVSLADIGEALTNPPEMCARCDPGVEPKNDSWETRLVQAIRDAVGEATSG